MAALSDYLENALLNHVLRATTYVSPVPVYVALFLTDPTDAGGGTEVSGGSYSRQVVTFNAPSGGSCDNALVTFTTATADWGTIPYIALFDAASAGNLLFHAPLLDTVTVLNGETFSIPAGQLIVTLQ